VAAEPQGALVRFRRTRPGVVDNLARVEAEGGAIAEVLHSADLLNVAVRWLDPRGALRCTFAYGGVGVLDAGAPRDAGTVAYVFLENGWATVEASLPRACTMAGALDLRVHVAKAQLPARLESAGLPPHPLELPETTVRVDLPRAADGVLQSGDIDFALVPARGEPVSFVVGVDEDGTPSAVTGFVRNW